MFTVENIKKKYAALVWILSSITLITYGLLSINNQNLPGAESLIAFVSSLQSNYIFAAAFLAILIEGLYVVGSFFPGSSIKKGKSDFPTKSDLKREVRLPYKVRLPYNSLPSIYYTKTSCS